MRAGRESFTNWLPRALSILVLTGTTVDRFLRGFVQRYWFDRIVRKLNEEDRKERGDHAERRQKNARDQLAGLFYTRRANRTMSIHRAENVLRQIAA